MKLVKESLIYGLTGALVSLSYLITTPLFTRILKPEEFALYSIYITIGSFLYILADAQIISSIAREYHVNYKEKSLDQLFSSAIVLEILFGISIGAVAYLIWNNASSLSNVLGFAATTELLLPIIVGVISRQYSQLYLIKIRFEHKPKIYLVLAVSEITISTILAVLFVIKFSLSVVGILWGIAIGQLIIALYCTIGLKPFPFKVKKKQISRILGYSIPIIPAVLGAWGLNQYAAFIMPSKFSTTELAYYIVAIHTASIMLLINNVFRLTLGPIIARWYTEEASEYKFVFIMDIAVSLGIFVNGLLLILSPFIMDIIAPEGYKKNWIIVSMLSIAYMWDLIAPIGGTGNAWERKTYRNTYATLFSLVTTITIVSVLSDEVGVYAFAIATLVGKASMSLLMILLGNRVHPIPFNCISISIVALLTLLGITIGYTAGIGYDYDNYFFQALIGVTMMFIGLVFFFIVKKQIQ